MIAKLEQTWLNEPTRSLIHNESNRKQMIQQQINHQLKSDSIVAPVWGVRNIYLNAMEMQLFLKW